MIWKCIMLISTDKIKKVPTVLILYSHQVLFFTQQVHTQNTIELLCYSFHQRFVGKKNNANFSWRKTKLLFNMQLAANFQLLQRWLYWKKVLNLESNFTNLQMWKVIAIGKCVFFFCHLRGHIPLKAIYGLVTSSSISYKSVK